MNHTLLKDDELWECLQSGDEGAFREIYVRYSREVFLLAYKKVHDKDTAEELAQNIFLSLWEKRKEASIKHLRAWLLGAVRFAVINHYKSQMVHERYEAYVRQHEARNVPAAEQLTMWKDLASAIDKGISLLPTKTQQVFRLSRYENRSIREISRDLNISEKAVEYHITQSLKWMRGYLKDFITVLLPFIPLFL